VNRLALCVLLVMLPGCTFGKRETVSLPAVMESYFRLCHPLSGALAMQVFNSGNLLGSAEMDWASDEEGWNIELTNAAGFTIVTLKQTGSLIGITGPQAKRFPAVAVDKSGFLEVDGHFVGIKSREVPCLLQGALPRAWMPLVYGVEGISDKRARILIGDDERDIVVRTRNMGDDKSEEVCADISWRNKLIFKSEVRWCVQGQGLKKGSITGISDYSVQWVRFDG
jgi:hypothetical protein